MLGYIFVGLCVLGAVSCQIAVQDQCFSQTAQYTFCGARCSMVPGSVQTYFQKCSEGQCCSDKLSACVNTDPYAFLCKVYRNLRICRYRRKLRCDLVDKTTTSTTTTSTTTTSTTTTATTTVATTTPAPTTTPIPTTTESTTTPAPSVRCGLKGPLSKRSIDKRIVGGENAQECEFPWQVPVNVKNALCGGSIIDEYTIVTAAHCIQPSSTLTASDIRVSVGEYNLGVATDQTDMEVESFTVHGDYNAQTYQNDIAIIKLKNPIQFNDCVAPICLPEKNQAYGGLSCEATGWGTIASGGSISYTLQKVTLPIVSQTECQKVFTATYITDLNLCAGLTAGGKDACQGDSGGPLACPTGADGTHVLAGIVSWGDGCADPGKPGVYTDVSEYVDWISTNSR